MARECEYPNDSCPAVWCQCRLTRALIAKPSDSARPIGDVRSGRQPIDESTSDGSSLGKQWIMGRTTRAISVFPELSFAAAFEQRSGTPAPRGRRCAMTALRFEPLPACRAAIAAALRPEQEPAPPLRHRWP